MKYILGIKISPRWIFSYQCIIGKLIFTGKKNNNKENKNGNRTKVTSQLVFIEILYMYIVKKLF